MAKKARGLKPEQLIAEVAGGDIRPFYLLYGEEEYEREAIAAELIEKIIPARARDFNLDIVRADRFDLLDFMQIFDSYPMMAEMRLVVLRDVHDLTADQCRGLERVFEAGVETTCLIAVGHKVDLRRKIFRQFATLGRAIEFRSPYDNQVPQWIQRYANRAGIGIEPAAIQLLSQYVGAKPRELVSEIEKMVSFAGTPIKVEAVEQIAGITRGASVFDLADAVGKGKRELAHELMMRFVNQGEEPTRAVAMIARHFHLLIKARDLLARPLSREEMAAQLGVAPFFLNGYLNQARNRSVPWLWAGLSALKEADWRLKSQGRCSEQLVLDLLIARLCTASSKRG